MPKAKVGVLLQVDVATKVSLMSLADKDKFLIMEIDDRHLFVEQNSLQFVREKVREFKEKNSWARPEDAPETWDEM